MKANKAVGNDEIPAEILKSLREEGIERLCKLISKSYETGEIPTDFNKSIIFTLQKKEQADKCENYRTISLTSHASKLLTRIIYRRMERVIEEIVGEDQFGFRKNRGTREAILALRLILEGRIKNNKDTFLVFVAL